MCNYFVRHVTFLLYFSYFRGFILTSDISDKKYYLARFVYRCQNPIDVILDFKPINKYVNKWKILLDPGKWHIF
jgi:hypothetical protein